MKIKIHDCINCGENNWTISHTGENKVLNRHHIPVGKCKNCGYKMPTVHQERLTNEFDKLLIALISMYNFRFFAGKGRRPEYELELHKKKAWKLRKVE